jgi:hypothetical protein
VRKERKKEDQAFRLTMEAGRPDPYACWSPPLGDDCGLRPSAPAGNGLPGHISGASVTEIGLLCTAPRIVERDAHHGAFSFLDLAGTVVAHENRLSCHAFLLVFSRARDTRLENSRRFFN